MDILQIVANIAQIIGVFWTLLFGSKAIKDVINKRRPSPPTITNSLLAAIFVVLVTLIFHPTVFNFLTPTPTTPYPPTGWNRVLFDPLDKPLYWHNNSDTAGGSCQFIGGAYHAILPNGGNSPCAGPSNMFSNFAIEVTMTIIDGSCGGIWFRGNGPAYFFQVCQDSQYNLFLYGPKTPQTILSSASSAIHSGLNQSNLIAVVAIGSHFDFYVNGQRIVSASDSTLSRGQVDFGATGNNPTEVAYTNTTVWEP
jgi:hypothetical protein